MIILFSYFWGVSKKLFKEHSGKGLQIELGPLSLSYKFKRILYQTIATKVTFYNICFRSASVCEKKASHDSGQTSMIQFKSKKYFFCMSLLMKCYHDNPPKEAFVEEKLPQFRFDYNRYLKTSIKSINYSIFS